MAKRVADFKLQIEVHSFLFLRFCSDTFSFFYIYLFLNLIILLGQGFGAWGATINACNFLFGCFVDSWNGPPGHSPDPLHTAFFNLPPRLQPPPPTTTYASHASRLKVHTKVIGSYYSEFFFIIFLEKRIVLVTGSLINCLMENFFFFK